MLLENSWRLRSRLTREIDVFFEQNPTVMSLEMTVEALVSKLGALTQWRAVKRQRRGLFGKFFSRNLPPNGWPLKKINEINGFIDFAVHSHALARAGPAGLRLAAGRRSPGPPSEAGAGVHR